MLLDKIKLCIIGCLCLVLIGCGNNKIAITKKLRDQYQLSNHELSRLQFYISDELVLKRVQDISKPRLVRDGRLVTEDVKFEDKVVIKEDTPGVAVYVNPEANLISVSFEEGFSLPFKVNGTRGHYRFVRNDSNHHRAQYTFFNVPYTANPKKQNIYLMIEKDALEDIVEREKVLSGRTID